jgi:aspartate/tyrosine/aromatic aminotransferase
MSDKTYNGWSNYATWRISLEIFDGFDPYSYFSDANDEFDADELAENLEQYAEQVIFECADVPRGLAMDYARAFLQEVNWREIAAHMVQEFAA